MYIIAGLGNPGSEYELTRHNIGFRVIDELAEEYNINIGDNKIGVNQDINILKEENLSKEE